MVLSEIHFDELSGDTVICDENFNYIFNMYSEKESSSSPNINKIKLTEPIIRDNSFSNKSEINLDDSDKKKIKKISYLPSTGRRSNLHSPKITDRNLTLKDELLYSLKFYFKSKKVADLIPEKYKNNNRSSSLKLKSDFSLLDRKFILGKIKTYLDDNEFNIDKGITRTPLFKTIRIIFDFLLENQNIALNFSRKIKESPSKFIRDKLQNLNEKMRQNDMNIKIKENSLRLKLNNSNNVEGIGKNKFNFFKSIAPDTEKPSFALGKVEDLSFLSAEDENEFNENDNFYRKYKDKRIKTLGENMEYMQREDKRLIGFRYPEIKQRMEIPIAKHNLKSNGEFYVKSMELLRKGNYFKGIFY